MFSAQPHRKVPRFDSSGMRPESKILGIIFVCLGGVIAIVFSLAEGAIGAEGASALLIGLFTLAAILFDALTPEADGIDLSISNLPGLYGTIYGLYYLTALVLYAFRSDVPQNNIVEIGILIPLGYLGFRGGIAVAGSASGSLRSPALSAREAQSLFLLCWFGFGMVLLGDAYMISTGSFFTHGTQSSAEPSLVESVLQEMTFPFESPILMISALLSATGVLRKRATASLLIFMTVLCALKILTGQFREIITYLIVVAAVLRFVRHFRISWRRLVIGGCFCTMALFLIMAARIANQYRGGGGGPA
jgi:hypothetical protein